MRRFFTTKITRTGIKAFLEKNASDDYTLDIGASEGTYREFFPNRVGLDVQMKAGVDVVGDAHALPFKSEEFDVVLCTEVLEHLHTPQRAVDEMYRVLKSGGKIVLTTRFIYPLHDCPHDYFRFTKYGLQHLFKEFECIVIEEETDSMGTLAVLLQTLAFKSRFFGGIVTKVWFLFNAQIIKRLSWIVREEIVSGRNEPKRVERPLMTSGYYLVCKKPQ